MGYPSAEVTCVTWARANGTIAGLVGTRVSKTLPEKPTMPYLTVRRVSGAPDSSEAPVLDGPMVQWDCYAARYKSGNLAKPDWTSAEALALCLMNEADLVSETPAVVDLEDGSQAQIDGMSVLSMGEVQENDTGWAHYQVTMMLWIRQTAEAP